MSVLLRSVRFVASVVAAAAALVGAGTSHAGSEIDARAVWAPSESVSESLWGACSIDEKDCLAKRMKAAGASRQAIAFAGMLDGDGYMESFTEFGRIDLVTAMFPFRANSNWQPLLVNGDPPVFDVNDWAHLESVDLKRSAFYRALAKRNPTIELWPDARFVVAESVRGGQRFVFDYPLLDGCHACDLLGFARLVYDFDTAGKLTAVALVGVRTP